MRIGVRKAKIIIDCDFGLYNEAINKSTVVALAKDLEGQLLEFNEGCGRFKARVELESAEHETC